MVDPTLLVAGVCIFTSLGCRLFKLVSEQDRIQYLKFQERRLPPLHQPKPPTIAEVKRNA